MPTSKSNLNKASACCVADAFALMEEYGWWGKLDSASCYNKGAEGPPCKKRMLEWTSSGGIRCYTCTHIPMDAFVYLGNKSPRQIAMEEYAREDYEGDTQVPPSPQTPWSTTYPQTPSPQTPSPQTPFPQIEVFDVENGEEMADLHAWGPDYPARRDREQVYIFG